MRRAPDAEHPEILRSTRRRSSHTDPEVPWAERRRGIQMEEEPAPLAPAVAPDLELP